MINICDDVDKLIGKIAEEFEIFKKYQFVVILLVSIIKLKCAINCNELNQVVFLLFIK